MQFIMCVFFDSIKTINLKIHKFHKYASPQTTNPQIFMFNLHNFFMNNLQIAESANFYKILHNSVSKQSKKLSFYMIFHYVQIFHWSFICYICNKEG
jgi:hypothetical protein